MKKRTIPIIKYIPATTKKPYHDLPRISPNQRAAPMDPKIKDMKIMKIATKREKIEDTTPVKTSMLFSFSNSILVLMYSWAFSSRDISKLVCSAITFINSISKDLPALNKKSSDYFSVFI
jgi:hypothetical protein